MNIPVFETDRLVEPEPKGRPYRICTRTVMDTSDPDITFDEDGVSNHWHDYQRQAALELLPAEERKRKLDATVEAIKRAGRSEPYDCILGLSGGTDSSYLAWLAVQLGLRPLVVHFDNGWNSELAVSNVENVLSSLGLDLHTFVMDWTEFRDLQRSYFQASVLDLEVPTDHMIFGALYQTARRHKIRYILSGNNVVTEAILPRAWYYGKFDLENIRDIHRQFGTVPLKKLPALGLWQLARYQLVSRIQDVRLLNLIEYDKREAKRLLVEDLGWRDYGGKHYESVFTRFYQGFILPRKFGIDKRRAHLSNLICSGHMTRDEALAELEEPTYDPALQQRDKRFVAKKLGWTDDEFEAILDLPNRSHLEFRTDREARRRYFATMRFLKPVTRIVKRFR